VSSSLVVRSGGLELRHDPVHDMVFFVALEGYVLGLGELLQGWVEDLLLDGLVQTPQGQERVQEQDNWSTP
jgi:hypothetical protein